MKLQLQVADYAPMSDNGSFHVLCLIADFRPFPPCFPRHFRLSPGGCWNWVGGVIVNPRYPQHKYGQFTLSESQTKGRKRTVCAHRLAYECAVGPIAPGLEIDHLCENKLCVNPAHLEAVTRSENMLRYFRRREASHV